MKISGIPVLLLVMTAGCATTDIKGPITPKTNRAFESAMEQSDCGCVCEGASFSSDMQVAENEAKHNAENALSTCMEILMANGDFSCSKHLSNGVHFVTVKENGQMFAVAFLPRTKE